MAAGWNPRMGGLVVCVFFVLGVMTGFSATGREITLRTVNTLSSYRDEIVRTLEPERVQAAKYSAVLVEWAGDVGIIRRAHRSDGDGSAGDMREGAIAIVERRDGFYELFNGGELRGPVSAAKHDDLPILSGEAVETARGTQLVDYTAVLVRAEAWLSDLISEMRIADDATASLFLERARTEVVIDLDQAGPELQRAIQVRRQWQGRESLIAAVDLTTPGQAVVRLHGIDGAPAQRKGGIRKVSSSQSATGLATSAEGSVAR
ncbi:MAG TPA: hypothetical protein VEU51_17900 [Candidatus Acidoferrales bacterium]|nr:hypothetical protein [Candidatus Acidoferrales bacterium]